tara:strand:+ start:170 stop:727 length:558 start_codon:yes stop_codon:yes gene_type:complete
MRIKNVPRLLIFLLLVFSNNLHANSNWSPALEGNKIILIRHALAPGSGDPDGFNIKDCTTQRNLDEKGIFQAKKIGKLFIDNQIPIDKVLSSQWCRCKDTALYAFKDFKEFSALNSTFSARFSRNESKQAKKLRRYVKKWDGKGKNLVLVTHYVIIRAMTGRAPNSGEIVITDKNFKILSTIKTN